MGVPISEVGYTPAMPRREDHEVHKDTWWHWTQKKTYIDCLVSVNELNTEAVYIKSAAHNPKIRIVSTIVTVELSTP